jgi:hypothetical protein
VTDEAAFADLLAGSYRAVGSLVTADGVPAGQAALIRGWSSGSYAPGV